MLKRWFLGLLLPKHLHIVIDSDDWSISFVILEEVEGKWYRDPRYLVVQCERVSSTLEYR